MTQANDAAAYSGWTVTSQQQTTDVDPSGNFVQGWRIYFTTAGGHTGSVFVAQSHYTPDLVRGVIASAAANIDAIGSLSGQ